MQVKKRLWVAAAAALMVAACGGGGGDSGQVPKAQITSIKSFGDSLSDTGTFSAALGNRIFGVKDTPNWVDRIGTLYNISKPNCNFYSFTGTTFVQNPDKTCTNYAIGGGVVKYPNASGGAAVPFTIPTQLSTAAAVHGSYSASDLLLVDGGGNDAAALITAYLGAASGAAGAQAYAGFLSEVLPAATVGAALATGAAGAASIGGAYMTKLADVLYDSVKTSALDIGAKRVVILNIPSVTDTPRFKLVLGQVAAANGGGAAGAAAVAQLDGLFRSWIGAFNSQLAKRAAGNSSVIVVDFYANFTDQVKNPAQYGLTNITTPVCPVVAVTSGGPQYNFATCTAAGLSAQTPPAGATGGSGWFNSWAFSDGFHPSPYGYQLMAQMVSKELAAAGWL